jgi:hypothetical protein
MVHCAKVNHSSIIIASWFFLEQMDLVLLLFRNILTMPLVLSSCRPLDLLVVKPDLEDVSVSVNPAVPVVVTTHKSAANRVEDHCGNITKCVKTSSAREKGDTSTTARHNSRGEKVYTRTHTSPPSPSERSQIRSIIFQSHSSPF